jgi:hypothetical protein
VKGDDLNLFSVDHHRAETGKSDVNWLISPPLYASEYLSARMRYLRISALLGPSSHVVKVQIIPLAPTSSS